MIFINPERQGVDLLKTEIRKRKVAHHYNCGLMVGMSFTASFLLIIVAVKQVLWLVAPIFLFGLSVPLTANLIMKGENAMMNSIKKALGINIVNMKLEALARHLKVKFLHVPEHYECEREAK